MSAAGGGQREGLLPLARATLATRPTEITCDEWLDLVARFVELELTGQPIPAKLRPVAEHLEVCPECLEEFEALKKALE